MHFMSYLWWSSIPVDQCLCRRCNWCRSACATLFNGQHTWYTTRQFQHNIGIDARSHKNMLSKPFLPLSSMFLFLKYPSLLPLPSLAWIATRTTISLLSAFLFFAANGDVVFLSSVFRPFSRNNFMNVVQFHIYRSLILILSRLPTGGEKGKSTRLIRPLNKVFVFTCAECRVCIALIWIVNRCRFLWRFWEN